MRSSEACKREAGELSGISRGANAINSAQCPVHDSNLYETSPYRSDDLAGEDCLGRNFHVMRELGRSVKFDIMSSGKLLTLRSPL